ncbi:hypothetical protein TCAL_16740 [Tigriopus californicus]|uniref:Uncharacterized protein n=1 Tax=Tigriopus californicus TaxID=6832 RepID=A0A553PSG5_TIGCA|nr:hypothetical protein TCAL_16740 [Tigriopus californicus]
MAPGSEEALEYAMVRASEKGVGKVIGLVEEKVETTSGTSSKTDIWTPMPVPLQYHNAGAMGLLSGRPIVVGGINKFDTSQESVEIFDPVTNAWTAKPNLRPPRSQHTLVQVDPGTVIVIGGWTLPQSQVVGYTDMLSSEDSQWTKLPDRPEVAYGCACGMVQLADGRNGILSIGGKGKSSLLSTAYFLDLASTT